MKDKNKIKKPHDRKNSVSNLFKEELESSKANRRDFLKMFGYSFALAGLASCETKVRKAMPYLINPKDIVPGKANYYASSFVDGSQFCSVVVKTREGRPIKIEGNTLSSITNGGTTAQTHSSILSLYDTFRYQYPTIEGKEASWDSVDKKIQSELKNFDTKGEELVLLTPTIFSPTTKLTIEKFIEKHPSVKWLTYDAVAANAIFEANEVTFNQKVIPDYRFDKAELIVSVGADFLGTWLSPTEYTKQFVKNRKISDKGKMMSQLIQLESIMSLTGSNADIRIPIKPSSERAILENLLNDLRGYTNSPTVEAGKCSVNTKDIANKLFKAKGKSIVVSGSNNRDNQLLVNAINAEIDSFNKTILFDNPLQVKMSDNKGLTELIDNMNAGKVKGLILYNVNPAYNNVNADKFISGIKKVPFTVAMDNRPNETTRLAKFVCPDNHNLESWNDYEPKRGLFSISQPTIQRIFKTRQFQESLLKWSDNPVSYYNFIQENWKNSFFPTQTASTDAIDFFDTSVQKGIYEVKVESKAVEFSEVFDKATASLSTDYAKSGAPELVIYESIALGEGTQANNPWLQELPDPMTKVCWDNYAIVSPDYAEELSLSKGDIININGVAGIPVYVSPGQAHGTIGIAMGYGREHCGEVGDKIGVNVYSLATVNNGSLEFYNSTVSIDKTGETDYPLAQTQTHSSMEGRELVRETSLADFIKDPSSGNESHKKFEDHKVSLYSGHEYKGHHWAMVIDLNACTGCSACVVSCHAENNVPVVGKEEVLNSREMHWMRIDRYFNGNNKNPGVVFQPVMCQHCDNASCENVCPVAATTHSAEGLNQMVYNRCVGTKYCGNNCPYKVRRFNWFNYTDAGTITNNLHDPGRMNTDLKRMVLNPDVTVRSQGVIEKCSLCVQRIQEGKMTAKLEKRALKDGEIQTACSQSCPADAIVFGDVNDKKSKVHKLLKSKRGYKLLEELFTMPSVNYLTKVRNKKS